MVRYFYFLIVTSDVAETIGDLFFIEQTHSKDLLKELLYYLNANDIGKFITFGLI